MLQKWSYLIETYKGCMKLKIMALATWEVVWAEALLPESAPLDWRLPKKSEMQSLLDERIVFYASLYKKAEEQIVQQVQICAR